MLNFVFADKFFVQSWWALHDCLQADLELFLLLFNCFIQQIYTPDLQRQHVADSQVVKFPKHCRILLNTVVEIRLSVSLSLCPSVCSVSVCARSGDTEAPPTYSCSSLVGGAATVLRSRCLWVAALGMDGMRSSWIVVLPREATVGSAAPNVNREWDTQGVLQQPRSRARARRCRNLWLQLRSTVIGALGSNRDRTIRHVTIAESTARKQRSFQHNDSFFIIDSCNELISNPNSEWNHIQMTSACHHVSKIQLSLCDEKGFCLIFSCCLLNPSYFRLCLFSWNCKHRSRQGSETRLSLKQLGFSPIRDWISRRPGRFVCKLYTEQKN